MKLCRMTLSIVLCSIILFGTLVLDIGGLFDLIALLSLKAEAADYKVGDIIEFGSYPQSDVTNSLGSVLNSQTGTWQSYNYYSGSGSIKDGQMKASSYMRFKDVTFNGNRYRGVTFNKYRPYSTGLTANQSNSFQEENGYSLGKIYWFKYEPLNWEVLDPSTGLVMCTKIIDSQPYNNYILADGTASNGYTACWGDSSKTYYANDWEKSSLRAWLNNDFYNAAFSESQKLEMLTLFSGKTSLTDSGNYYELDSTNNSNKVTLLSTYDVTNPDYGFNPDSAVSDPARRKHYSDYAKCQGLNYNYSPESECYGYSSWWLSSSNYNDYFSALTVSDSGSANKESAIVILTCFGVCPVLKLNAVEPLIVEKEFSVVFKASNKTISMANYKEGDMIVKPENPTKDGYIFKGWIPEVPSKMPAYDMTFTALFEKSPESYEYKEHTARFVLDGKTICSINFNAGDMIVKPENPTKDGYIFKGWIPEIPSTMPAYDMTFTAIFEKYPEMPINPTAASKLKVPTDTEVEYASRVTVKATATDVPKGYYIALYDGKTQLVKGDNTKVSYDFPGELTSSIIITAKIIDDNENVQKDANGKELICNFEIKSKTGFFVKLIAFFKRIFRILPDITVEP